MSYREIEIAVANLFDYRRNIIIPNVSHGFFYDGHEADILIVTPQNYVTEVEIKTSISDLKADFKKMNFHGIKNLQKNGYVSITTPIIAQLYYALPEDIYEQGSEIIINNEPRAGLIKIEKHEMRVKGTKEKCADRIRGCVPIPEQRKERLLHLAAMRVWSLKEQLDKKEKK